jgi:excisionase family DNA binding protein
MKGDVMETLPVNPVPRLLSVDEAAQAFGLNRHTLRAWVQKGKVPVVRLDSTVRIDRNDLEAMIQSAKRLWSPQQSLAVNARKGHQSRRQRSEAPRAA